MNSSGVCTAYTKIHTWKKGSTQRNPFKPLVQSQNMILYCKNWTLPWVQFPQRHISNFWKTKMPVCVLSVATRSIQSNFFFFSFRRPLDQKVETVKILSGQEEKLIYKILCFITYSLSFRKYIPTIDEVKCCPKIWNTSKNMTTIIFQWEKHTVNKDLARREKMWHLSSRRNERVKTRDSQFWEVEFLRGLP